MSLPTELDFALDPRATPARLNAAMDYIVARFRALESNTPTVASAVDQLKTLGLDRLNEVLSPIFDNATSIDEALTALQAEWLETDIIGTMEAEVLGALRSGVAVEFDTLAKMATALVAYRSKYLGAKAAAPTLDDNGLPVSAGAMYFDTTLSKMRVYSGTTWNDAGSAVQGVMVRQSFTAVGGETSVAVSGLYDPGNIIVYVNGLAMSPTDVDVTSGVNIVFTAGALSAGDEVSWVKFTQLTLANVYLKTESDNNLATALSLYYTSGQVDTLVGLLANPVSFGVTTTSMTLSAGQAANGVLTFTNALTANSTVILPNKGKWVVVNNTTGPYTLTFRTLAGTGVTVAAGTSRSILGDGTNIIAATTDFTNADLKGAPTATTPANGDNSNRVSTTAWITSNIQALVSGCIAAVATAAGFSASFAGTGYVKLPSWLGGLIVQWGVPSGPASGASVAFTFAMTFPTDVLSIAMTPVGSGITTGPTGVTCQVTTTGGTVYNSSGVSYAGGVFYIAIGR